MPIKGLEKPIVFAGIYLAFFALSALVAFVLFRYLPASTANAEGSLGGLGINAGGAIAGFLISFLLLHRAYRAMVQSPRRSLTGNVFDTDDEPVPGATISVDGVDRQKTTDATGWFRIDVDDQSEWTIRARTAGASGFTCVAATEIDLPVRIRLKKKA